MSNSRPVILGRTPTPAFTHWGVQVGETWYEISTDNNSGGKTNRIREGQLAHAAKTGLLVRTTVGYTYKTEEEIEAWNSKWEKRNPNYCFVDANCQKHSKEFCEWACDGRAKLPPMEIGISAYGVGPRAQAVTADGRARGNVSVGRCDAQHVICSAAAEGPSASVDAICGRQGFGAMADASLAHAEAKMSIGKISVGVSAKTGARVADGNAEVSILGFGFKVGQNGIHLHNPFLGFGLGT